MRLALRAALFLLALPLLFGFTGMRAGLGSCPTKRDFQGSMWQDAAFITGCSTTQGCQIDGSDFFRWTRQAMADCEGCLVYVGDADLDRGLPLVHTSPAIPFVTKPVFDLHFSSGTPRGMNVENTLEVMAAVRALVPPGRRGPIFVADIRWDVIQRWILDQAAPYDIQPDWILRSDRTIQDFGAWVHGLGGKYSHCRFPNGIDTTEQYDDAEGGTRCNRTFGTGNGEWGVRMYDQLEALETGLGDHMVGYVFNRTPGNTSLFPSYLLMNLKHPDYQNFAVGMCAALIAQGFDACDYPHKRHYFCASTGSAPCTPVQLWPVTGDGRGGADETMGLGLSDDLDTIEEITTVDNVYTGPPEIPNGVAGCATAGGCPYLYHDYMQGYVETQRKNTAAANPTVVSVTPYAWKGCPKDAASWDSAYADAACDNRFNDADGAACETCSIREVAQRASYVMIDMGNKTLADTSIGSGAGSGFSFAELKALLLNPPGGGPRPLEVYPYNEHQGGGTASKGTPARVCGDPNQIEHENPEPGIGAALEDCEIGDCAIGAGVIGGV